MLEAGDLEKPRFVPEWDCYATGTVGCQRA